MTPTYFTVPLFLWNRQNPQWDNRLGLGENECLGANVYLRLTRSHSLNFIRFYVFCTDKNLSMLNSEARNIYYYLYQMHLLFIFCNIQQAPCNIQRPGVWSCPFQCLWTLAVGSKPSLEAWFYLWVCIGEWHGLGPFPLCSDVWTPYLQGELD